MTSCKRKSPSPSSKLTLVSFSFAKSDGGIPVDFDLYYDLRDIKSTAWKIPGYHCKSGCDTSISSAVFQEESAILHYNQICTTLETNTAKELQVAIGCKSGRHRSVAFVEKLAHEFQATRECAIYHIDLDVDDADTETFVRCKQYHCSVCTNHTATTAIDMNLHLLGKKHAKRLAKQNKRRKREEKKEVLWVHHTQHYRYVCELHVCMYRYVMCNVDCTYMNVCRGVWLYRSSINI